MDKVYNAELQERVRQLIDPETGKMSQAAFGRAIGYSTGSIISQYLSGAYKGDVNKLEKAITNYFDFQGRKQDFERDKGGLRLISRTEYVPTTISERIYMAIEYIRLTGGIGILHGDAGIGKTRAVLKYRKDNEGSVIYFRAKEGIKTPNEIFEKIADMLGIVNYRNKKERIEQIRNRLEGKNNIIIIDEAHYLTRRAVDSLKELAEPNEDTSDECASIVLVGNTCIMDYLNGANKEKMRQFRNRVVYDEEYKTTQTKMEDIRKIFTYLVERKMEKELNFLYKVSKSECGLRGAVIAYNSAVTRDDVSLKSLMQAVSSTGARLI